MYKFGTRIIACTMYSIGLGIITLPLLQSHRRVLILLSLIALAFVFVPLCHLFIFKFEIAHRV